MSRTEPRKGIDRLPEHLAATYRIEVGRTRELDLGVFAVERTDGAGWGGTGVPESARGPAR
jgi:hypothetical protein